MNLRLLLLVAVPNLAGLVFAFGLALRRIRRWRLLEQGSVEHDRDLLDVDDAVLDHPQVVIGDGADDGGESDPESAPDPFTDGCHDGACNGVEPKLDAEGGNVEQ